MVNFFLCELSLTLTVSLKLKKKKKKAEGRYLQGTLDIEFERNWSFGLGSTLGDIHTDFFFQFQGFFGKRQ